MLMFQFHLVYLITVYIKGAFSYLSLMKNHYKKCNFEMFNIRVGHLMEATIKGPCYTSLFLLALDPGCSSHQVQDTDACL